MDTPTYVIIAALIASLVSIILFRLSRLPKVRALGNLSLSISAIWLCITVLGEHVFTWAGNATCSAALGCVSGFFGFDAFEHLFFGVALALVIVFLCMRFPKYSILHSERWKTVLTIVATVVLVSVLWEIFECIHDAFRVDILHEALSNLRLHIDLLDQPSNLDTMGDLSFAMLGSVIGFFLTVGKKAGSKTRKSETPLG
ncbi:MAG: hypothetical protein WA001_04570 [Patescibacteria group bacterium]